MTVLNSGKLTRVLFRLLAALELYHAELDILVRSCFSGDHARRLSRVLSRIGALSGAVPALAADLADIALRHQQLMEALRHAASAWHPVVAERLSAAVGRHRLSVNAAQDKCTHLLLA